MDMVNDDHEILIHPRRGRREKSLPQCGLLVVNPSEAQDAHRRWRDNGGEARSFFNSQLTVEALGRSFLAGPAIGAPMAAIAMEKLIVLGAESIVLFGWCGAIAEDLHIGDVVVPDKAVSGEGTSKNYPHLQPLTPHCAASDDLREWLGTKGMVTRSGTVWSTDAIFREDRRVLMDLRETQGVAAVDMEFSALCAVVAFRRIAFSAILVVSDELSGKKWLPGFGMPRFIEAKSEVLDLLLQGADLWRR